MLYRKISAKIEEYLTAKPHRMLMIDGARQIGKSFIIRWVGEKIFPNFIEINMEEDKLGPGIFAEVKTIEDFYLAVSAVAGNRLVDKDNTLIFIDEIQVYQHLLTLIKFLVQDDKFTYIASGSLLGITLQHTQSIPIGSLEVVHMYPMDFEEFLIANNVGSLAIQTIKRSFMAAESLSEAMHNRIFDLFKKYLIVGGLPKAVATYVETRNVALIRSIQREVHELYEADCTKYEQEYHKRLKIRRIYEMLPSVLENKKKRIVIKDIEGKDWKRGSDYQEEFDYLVSSGVVLEDKAVSTPTYPLIANSAKNLLKLYLNDVGILTSIYYRNNIQAIMSGLDSINLGTVYETVVAQELKAHGFDLFYYDNKKNGEVDFLIDDVENLSNIPLEVKSGKDYKRHTALTRFLDNKDYNIRRAYVLSNAREVTVEGKITYIPVYYVMCFKNEADVTDADLLL